MKIYTDYIDIELTIDEFEHILDSGLLETVVATIASLSVLTGYAISEGEPTDIQSVVNGIYQDSLHDEDCSEGVTLPSKLPAQSEDSEDDEENETVQRIYGTVFGKK